eukprot:COSAG06_NODE_5281_length_3589_cov_12.089112_3_plen_422_part_00
MAGASRAQRMASILRPELQLEPEPGLEPEPEPELPPTCRLVEEVSSEQVALGPVAALTGKAARAAARKAKAAAAFDAAMLDAEILAQQHETGSTLDTVSVSVPAVPARKPKATLTFAEPATTASGASKSATRSPMREGGRVQAFTMPVPVSPYVKDQWRLEECDQKIGAVLFANNAPQRVQSLKPKLVQIPGICGDSMTADSERYGLPPAAFVIENFLSAEEVAALLALRSHKDTKPEKLQGRTRTALFVPNVGVRLWDRLKPHVIDMSLENGPRCEPKKWEHPSSLNEHIKFQAYAKHGIFHQHKDGYALRVKGQPGTTLENEGDQSLLTVLIYLNDVPAREGGSTSFLAADEESLVKVQPRAGMLLAFDHRLTHTGSYLRCGEKHVILTQVMYRRTAEAKVAQADELEVDQALWLRQNT